MSCRSVVGDTPSNFKLPNVVVITTDSTYTSPPGVDYLEVYAVGGGGGGGGASSGTTSQGCGGGAGGVSFKYVVPGTYDIVVGLGGAGNTGTATGTAGGFTTFGGTVLRGNGGSGGNGGGSAVPRRGGAAGTLHASAAYMLVSEPGQPGFIDRNGAGGSNYFGNGGVCGSGVDGSVLSNGSPGSGLGGGGSGGLYAAATSGGGANGGVIIIEHY